MKPGWRHRLTWKNSSRLLGALALGSFTEQSARGGGRSVDTRGSPLVASGVSSADPLNPFDVK